MKSMLMKKIFLAFMAVALLAGCAVPEPTEESMLSADTAGMEPEASGENAEEMQEREIREGEMQEAKENTFSDTSS